jgi:hypothetical protein
LYPGFTPNAQGELKPIVKPRFTRTSKPETAITLEGNGERLGGVKVKIRCATEAAEGELTGPKMIALNNARFTGCESNGSKCSQEGGAVGEIALKDLTGVLGIVSLGLEPPATEKLGVMLTPAGSAEFTRFTCGGLIYLVTGHIIYPVAANKMVLSEIDKFTATAGNQAPQQFVGESEEKVWEVRFERLTSEFEDWGVNLTTTRANEESMEANSVL